MDLTALDIFRTVAEEGSVTRAAGRLGRAQSNVTTRVQQLEEQVGATLFLREGRRMALTAEGETLLGYARRLLALADEAAQALHPGRPGGRLRLGAMESTAAARLPAPLAALHAQWPEVHIELSTGASRALVDQVRTHALDAALVAWPPPGLEGADALEHMPVVTETLRLALPAAHPDVGADGALAVDRLAAFAPGCTYRRIGEEHLARRSPDGSPPRVLELASYHAILACVAAGRCAAVVPQAVIDLMRDPPPVRLLPLGTCDTVLVQRRGYRSAALDALRDALLAGPR